MVVTVTVLPAQTVRVNPAMLYPELSGSTVVSQPRSAQFEGLELSHLVYTGVAEASSVTAERNIVILLRTSEE